MIPVYVVEENIDGQWRPRAVYKEELWARLWIKVKVLAGANDADNFKIEEVDGVGLRWV